MLRLKDSRPSAAALKGNRLCRADASRLRRGTGSRLLHSPENSSSKLIIRSNAPQSGETWRANRRFGLLAMCCVIAWACEQPGKPSIEVRSSLELRLPLDEEYDDVRDADWIDDSTIALVSGNGARLSFATVHGQFQTVGSFGSGPSEYRDLFALRRLRDSVLLTVDNGVRRATAWDRRGHAIASIALPGPIVDGLWEIGSALAFKSPARGSSKTKIMKIEANQKGELVLSERALPGVSCIVCNMSVAHDGSVALAVGETAYRVVRFDSVGRELPSIERVDVPLVVLSEWEVDSAATLRRSFSEKMRRSGMSDSAIDDLLRTFKPSRVRGRFVASGIRFASDGSLWVQRNVVRGEAAAVDVFDGRGTLLTTVRLPVGFRLLRIAKRRLLGVEIAPDGSVFLTVVSVPGVAEAAAATNSRTPQGAKAAF